MFPIRKTKLPLNDKYANLTRQQRKKIEAAVIAAKSDLEKPISVQSSIPYLAMYPDGVCKVTEKLYSKSIEFFDVSYMLAGKDEQTAIFEGLCDFYNYFDPSISVQQTFISRRAAKEEFQKAIDIPRTGDYFDHIRDEYGGILKTQLEKGNNGLVRTKYLTFAIEADSLKMAKSWLGRIEMDIVNHFKMMGAAARPLSGKERLAAVHGVLHLGTTERFAFEWGGFFKTGLSTKDFIAPTSFHFGEGRTFRVGGKIGAVSFLQIIAPELNDRILADFLEVDGNVVVNLHIRSIEQSAAVKMVKRKITDIDGMKVNEQKRAVRSGYDMDIMPSDLNTYGDEAKKLLKDLQNRNEKMFLLTVLTMNVAGSKQTLDNRVFQMSGIAQKHNCALQRLDYMQESGLMSSIPLGMNHIPIQRGLTTSGAAIFIPFITREIFQGGEALYYGRNAISGNMIMADRKSLKNPKGLYCKGRSKDRNLQAVLTFAAQMDGHPQERKGSGTASGAKRERQSPQEHFTPANVVFNCRVKFQKSFEKSSDLPLLFLLLVEGSIPKRTITDYTPKKQERSRTTILYTLSTHNSIPKGAKTMQTVKASGKKTRRSAEAADFKKRIGSTVYTVSVHFSKTSRETIEDKILRQIESEARKPA